MKITKRQLKRIIREERQKLSENILSPRGQQAQEQIEEILNGLWDDGVDNAGLIQLLEALIADINNGFIGEPT